MEDARREAWLAYWADRSDENRNAVVVLYLDLVQRMAAGLLARQPRARVWVEELVTAGVERMMRVLPEYDPQVCPFEAFVIPCIRFAFIDCLRRQETNGAARQAARREVRETTARLLQESRGEVSQGEIDEALGQQLRDLAAERFLSLDNLAGGSSWETHADLLPDREYELDTAQKVCELLRPLDLRSAIAVYLYYLGGMPLKQIGPLLGVTESRACQVIKQALATTRTHFELAADPPAF